MTEKDKDIGKILEERARLDGILSEQFTRRVAIMFTDIKGSTLFYERHGDIDGRLMVHKHNDIVLPVINENGGRLIKTIGDATMTVFDEPVDAARAACEIQKKLSSHNAGKTEKQQIHIRAGLNYGAGIVEESDVYGDVVNTASRIESLADGDEIFVSEDFYRAVRSNDEFIFRYADTVAVKGKSEPVKAYRLIWRDEDLYLGRTRKAADAQPEKEGVFVIEASLSSGRLKISGYERSGGGEERPVKNYQEIAYNDELIKRYIQDIAVLFNRANSRGKIGNDILIKLKDTGGLLFDELIPKTLKEQLSSTELQNIVVSIDDTLVHVPWELLYDGRDFLCQRFSMGRSVSTRQQVSVIARSVSRPLKIQVLADPRGDLKASYDEGIAIKNEMELLDDWVDLSLRTTDIRTDYVRSRMRYFDIVHYAGHAEHLSEEPEKSGWLLKDGRLEAGRIMSMTGQAPMPSLIFSNACSSGQTGQWQLSVDYEKRIFGLANAFLLTGVQHYIGTFWEIPDEAGCHFAVNFYSCLIKGFTIGSALRRARHALIEKYGEDTIVWASYMLYGDPTTRYIDMAQDPGTDKADAKSHAGTVVSVKDGEGVSISSPTKKTPVLAAVAAAALIAIVAAGTVFIRRGDEQRVNVMVQSSQQPANDGSSARRIDELVTSLAVAYKSGNYDSVARDVRKDGPLTMVLMDIKPSNSPSGGADRDMLVNLLAGEIQADGGVQMVERELLEKLLTELKLSSSSLADPSTALRIGKVLSARIIITGSILADTKGQVAVLRLIDTETTAVRKVISVESDGKAVTKEMAKEIGLRIKEWVNAEYNREKGKS